MKPDWRLPDGVLVLEITDWELDPDCPCWGSEDVLDYAQRMGSIECELCRAVWIWKPL